jgi:hypothetical protein
MIGWGGAIAIGGGARRRNKQRREQRGARLGNEDEKQWAAGAK